MEKKVTSHILKGLIISVILVLYYIIIEYLNLGLNKFSTLILIFILFGGLVVSAYIFAKQQNYNVKFGNLFAHSFRVNAIIVLVILFWTVISMKFIFKNQVTDAINQYSQSLASDSNLSNTQRENAINNYKKILVPLSMGKTIFIYGILGAIGSLIAASVVKKNPTSSNPFQENKPQEL